MPAIVNLKPEEAKKDGKSSQDETFSQQFIEFSHRAIIDSLMSLALKIPEMVEQAVKKVLLDEFPRGDEETEREILKLARSSSSRIDGIIKQLKQAPVSEDKRSEFGRIASEQMTSMKNGQREFEVSVIRSINEIRAEIEALAEVMRSSPRPDVVPAEPSKEKKTLQISIERRDRDGRAAEFRIDEL